MITLCRDLSRHTVPRTRRRMITDDQNTSAMSGGRQRSAILRAEMLRGGSGEITCALEMTDDSIFIVTNELPSVGDTVTVRLSFPRTVRPFLASVRVRQVRMSGGPGSPSGFVADFVVENDEARRQISEVARRLRPSGTVPANRELAVLLVENNQLIRDMFAYAVERYFGQRACKVHLAQASTAAEAGARLEERAIDLAIIDHQLAGENGAAFIGKLRADAKFRRVPIVATSVAGGDVRRAMLDAGADLFLHKPIVLKDLFCTLEFLMSCEIGSELGAA
jgi:CheY-like chemotaxis protein